jgi:type VI secretion system protein VasG
MEEHHNVRILDEAIVECVKLSHRYITGRQLPDKSVSVLDTACAKVAIGQGAIPAAIEDATRRIQNLTSEINSLEREQVTGADHEERIADLTAKRTETDEELTRLNEQWEKEKALVEQIKTIRGKLEMSRLDSQLADLVGEGGPASGQAEPAAAAATAEADGAAGDDTSGTATAAAPETAAPIDTEFLRSELKRLNAELKELQGENPLMQPVVNGQTVAEVISGWTGIPIGKMVADEINAVLNLAGTLRERVLGQDHALEAISQRIRTSRAGLTDPKRPIGVFLLVGTSGVGKTETALALAESLYGGERNLISINMSEYQEAHTV